MPREITESNWRNKAQFQYRISPTSSYGIPKSPCIPKYKQGAKNPKMNFFIYT